jgi:hypothetical protein
MNSSSELRNRSKSAIEFDFLRKDELSLHNHKEGPQVPAVIRAKNGNTSLEYPINHIYLINKLCEKLNGNDRRYLKSYCTQNRQEILDLMLKYGAVLFRGFDVKSPQDFEDVAMVSAGLAKQLKTLLHYSIF